MSDLLPVAHSQSGGEGGFVSPIALGESSSSTSGSSTDGSSTGGSTQSVQSILNILATLGVTASPNTAGGVSVDATNQSTGLNFSQESPNGLSLTDTTDVLNLGSGPDFVQS